jgi:hypothetical protein
MFSLGLFIASSPKELVRNRFFSFDEVHLDCEVLGIMVGFRATSQHTFEVFVAHVTLKGTPRFFGPKL